MHSVLQGAVMPQQNALASDRRVFENCQEEEDTAQSRDECYSINSMLSPLPHPTIDTHSDLRTHSWLGRCISSCKVKLR